MRLVCPRPLRFAVQQVGVVLDVPPHVCGLCGFRNAFNAITGDLPQQSAAFGFQSGNIALGVRDFFNSFLLRSASNRFPVCFPFCVPVLSSCVLTHAPAGYAVFSSERPLADVASDVLRDC